MQLLEFLGRLPSRKAMAWAIVASAMLVPGWFGTVLLPNGLSTTLDRLITAVAFGLLSLAIGIAVSFVMIDELLKKNGNEDMPEETKDEITALAASVSALTVPTTILAFLVSVNLLSVLFFSRTVAGLGAYFLLIFLSAVVARVTYWWKRRDGNLF